MLDSFLQVAAMATLFLPVAIFSFSFFSLSFSTLTNNSNLYRSLYALPVFYSASDSCFLYEQRMYEQETKLISNEGRSDGSISSFDGGYKAFFNWENGSYVCFENNAHCDSHFGGVGEHLNHFASGYVPQDNDMDDCTLISSSASFDCLAKGEADGLLHHFQLQEHLNEMTIMLDNLLQDRKELQGKLHTAIRECRTLESMLAEVEDENDKIIAKFESLEGEVQVLKLENIQLKKILPKDNWRFKGQGDPGSLQNVGSGDSDGRQSFYKDTWESEGKRKAEIFSFSNTGSKTGGPTHSFLHCTVSKSLETRESPYQRRDAALQSLFSALLSLLVGYIVWEAQNPCMPLILALLVVVGMSLNSVFQFLSSIKNKPASDAVALLSINWFILGTLTYPVLPTVAHVARVFASFL